MHLRKHAVLIVVAAVLMAFDSAAYGCGDKFLIVGRGSRFQRAYVSVHPASLLVVGANVTGQREVQSRLKIAGHRLRVVSVGEIPAALAAGNYDFVLADFRDVPEVARAMQERAETSLLPVIDGSSKVEMAAAAKEYKCLLEDARGMKAARHFLAAIDLAMESKLKATGLQCDIKSSGQ